MSDPALSQAANQNLERVLRLEQEANARRILTIRALMGLVGSALFFFMGTADPADEAVIAVSRYGTYAYFVAGTALLVLARLVPRTLLATTYAVALVDVPLLTFIHYTQTTALPEYPWMNVPANVGMMVALITLSALSLSWVVIVTTATAAAVSIFLVSGHGGFEPLPRALLIILAPGVAMTCSSLVSRIRRLVRQSRERDLLGKYILGERIGSGGMAEVFAATYSPEGGFERRVAIKRILPSFANNPDAVLLFRREAELGASLAHPNLVQILDFGSDGGSYFLAMEYVDGCTLGDVLRGLRSRDERMSLKALTALTWCLADALGYLHDHVSPTGQHQQLVHRDVNPPNVLLSRAGDVKLSDFGVARDVGGATLTEVGVLRGKLAYASPEVILGEKFDGRADLYALGITLYECLSGQRPFSGDSDTALARSILETPVRPIGELRADFSPELVALFSKLIERSKDARTPSAMALIQQLAALGPNELDLAAGRRELAACVLGSMRSKALISSAPTQPSAAEVATGALQLPL